MANKDFIKILKVSTFASLPTTVKNGSVAYAEDTTRHYMFVSPTWYQIPNSTEVAAKQNVLGFTPENIANKDIDATMVANSDTKYPSQKATLARIVVAEGKIGKAYNATGVEFGAIPMRRKGTTNASGVARVYLTDNGLSTGVAVYTALSADDVFPVPVGATSNYQVVSWVVSADFKYVDVTVNQLGSLILGLVNITSAASGVIVKVLTIGK